jgi:hypothetical protein
MVSGVEPEHTAPWRVGRSSLLEEGADPLLGISPKEMTKPQHKETHESKTYSRHREGATVSMEGLRGLRKIPVAKDDRHGDV